MAAIQFETEGTNAQFYSTIPVFHASVSPVRRQVEPLRGTMVGDDLTRQLRHLSSKLAEGCQKRHTRGPRGQIPKWKHWRFRSKDWRQLMCLGHRVDFPPVEFQTPVELTGSRNRRLRGQSYGRRWERTSCHSSSHQADSVSIQSKTLSRLRDTWGCCTNQPGVASKPDGRAPQIRSHAIPCLEPPPVK